MGAAPPPFRDMGTPPVAYIAASRRGPSSGNIVAVNTQGDQAADSEPGKVEGEMSQKASIIILNWNGLEDTIECLDSLKKITYPDYEVVVVDNASSGDDVRVLRERYGSSITVIANDRNYGFSEGNNIGMRHAMNTGVEYLVLLNNDTVVDPEFLSELVRHAQDIPKAGILAGKIYYYYSPARLQSVGGYFNWLFGTIREYGDREDRGQSDRVVDRDFVYANGMLIRRQVVEAISYLDTTFFFGIEEYDYSTRATRAGFRVVYVPTSKIWHKGGASRDKLSQYPATRKMITADSGFLLYKHWLGIFKKHSPRGLFVFTFVCHMIVHVGPELVKGPIRSMSRRAMKRRNATFKMAPDNSGSRHPVDAENGPDTSGHH